jgi:hypothetical protein
MNTLTEIMHYLVAIAVMAGGFWLWAVLMMAI